LLKNLACSVFLKDHPVAELPCTGQTLHGQSLMQADLGLFCVKKEAEGNLDEQQRGGSAERIMGKCLLWGAEEHLEWEGNRYLRAGAKCKK
jgi:hypothetical protein